MFYATKKSDFIDAVFLFDGEKCTIESMKNHVEVLTNQRKNDEGEVLSVYFTVNGEEIKKGRVYAIKGSKIIDCDIYKICRFFDTLGGWGLIKDASIDCYPLEVNQEIDMPTSIQTGKGVAQMGDYVAINKDQTTFVCDKNDFDFFGAAI